MDDDLGAAFAAFTAAAEERIAAAERAAQDAQKRAATLSIDAYVPGRRIEPEQIRPRLSAHAGGRVPAQVHPTGEAGRGGFSHFGEFAAAVRRAGVRGGDVDNRLQGGVASTWANEGSGADGGFAVPPDFRSTIMTKAFGEDSLIARTMRIATVGNTLTLPTSMTTAWSTGGVNAYWEDEAAPITQSRPSLQNVTVKLHKLVALVPVTDELLEDAPAMGAQEAGSAIDFKLSNAIAFGSGVGQPLGFMNAPCSSRRRRSPGRRRTRSSSTTF